MTTGSVRVFEVLLVDDDVADIALITEAFTAHHAPVRLHTAGDGIEALAFLRRENGHGDAPRPDLVLLDLNMPRMDGREVLNAVKTDPDLGTIPVVVFTTSGAPPDITTSYARHANAYVTKPLDLDEFDAVVAKIYDFYGELNTRLPLTSLDVPPDRQGQHPVSTPPRPPHDTSQQPLGPLATRIVALADTPDDVSDIDARLAAIAQAAADTVTPVSYASITAVRDGSPTTVAASSELATAVDQAQYADDSGPCLDALHDGTPVGVDDIPATMTWPGFREAATAMGLHASLSIPLFAGSGAPIAALNLYSHDAVAMAPLNARIWAVYHADPAAHPQPDTPLVDTGGEDLVAGLNQAFEVRAAIQRAIGVVMAGERCSAEDAYLTLRVRAAEAGTSLTGIATALHPHLPRGGEPHP